MYPKVIIDIEKLRYNISSISNSCHKNNVSMAFVTKAFCANKDIVEAVKDLNFDYFADSRIENLADIDSDKEKILLRIPMISQAEKVTDFCDISLNSEIETIRELNRVSQKKSKKHKIILMVDLGDLREGIFEDIELYEALEEIMEMEFIELIGIGSNLTCYGGIIPKPETFRRLDDIRKNIKNLYNKELGIISGGNSSSLHLIHEGKVNFNNLRIGEAALLGRETAFSTRWENCYDDAFILEAEVIETKIKPSMPIGEIGFDAFGNKPVFEDRGLIKRTIVGIGRQDIYPDKLIPLDEGIKILGASSDHLILDTGSSKKYEIGDIIRFKLLYASLVQVFTSKYVYKEIK